MALNVTHRRDLILFKILALYKSFTYLLTYLIRWNLLFAYLLWKHLIPNLKILFIIAWKHSTTLKAYTML